MLDTGRVLSISSEVRFNSVNAVAKQVHLLEYPVIWLVLYAEKLTFRKDPSKQRKLPLGTFLLSERSSGINGQGIVVDAGMGLNYFDH